MGWNNLEGTRQTRDYSYGHGGGGQPAANQSPPAANAKLYPLIKLSKGWNGEISAEQRDEHGRVARAQNGQDLAAYAPGWDGDWTNLDYRMDANGDGAQTWVEVVNYLCQRILDLTAPGNTTLNETQKALLWATVRDYRDGDGKKYDPFSHYIGMYLTQGTVAVDQEHFDSQGNFVERYWSQKEGIVRVAEKLAELEKQANLPNADMRAGNRLLREIGADTRNMSDEEIRKKREALAEWAARSHFRSFESAWGTVAHLYRAA